MCGILGALPYTCDTTFESALHRIAHRGPDGFGIWQDPEGIICLGHRRLAILDITEAGKQPMHFNHLVVTFNGEIYNFLEIKEELKKKGYQFHNQSDTEILLAAFQEWGENCLHKFNGMWAFAIWDKQKKRLFLSRDRFGKKPLFYAFIGNTFVFASEMKAIFPFLPEVKPSKDFEWCKKNIFAYETTEKTLIEGITRFPAASFAFLDFRDIDKKELKFFRYWETAENLVEVPKKYEDQVEKFRELFIDACRIRMRSDVPIGTALSGGLDSSATICTMAHIGKNQLKDRVSSDWQHAFIATFPGTFLDESYYARKVTDYLNIPASYIPIDPVRGIERLEKYLYLFEELYITSPVPMIDLYAAVKSGGVTVTLDGHGADELFAGYGNDIFKAFYDAGLNFSEIQNILKTYNGLRDIESSQVPNEKVNLFAYLRYIKENHKGFFELIKFLLKTSISKTENISKGKMGVFNSYLYGIFHKTILPTLLRNYDRYSMANGVEIRMPFMDHRLVSYCFSLSWKSKLRNGYTKAIVRDALKDIMPQEVVWRTTKIGFNTPIVDWMKNEWKEFLLDNLYSTDFENCYLIDKFETTKKVEKVINDEKATFSDGEQAWISLMPYLWEKSLVKSKLN